MPLTLASVLIARARLFDLAMAFFLATIERLIGMESPATADEADDSYRTLGVGRSLPSSHDTKQ
jgi:hypothetical protein